MLFEKTLGELNSLKGRGICHTLRGETVAKHFERLVYLCLFCLPNHCLLLRILKRTSIELRALNSFKKEGYIISYYTFMNVWVLEIKHAMVWHRFCNFLIRKISAILCNSGVSSPCPWMLIKRSPTSDSVSVDRRPL